MKKKYIYDNGTTKETVDVTDKGDDVIITSQEGMVIRSKEDFNAAVDRGIFRIIPRRNDFI